MMKKFILGAILASTLSYAQVGVNTSNPQATFHVDGAKDNPATGAPSNAQQLNDFAVTNAGRVGVGTTAPTQKVDVADGNVRVRNINNTPGVATDKFVVADPNGVLKTVPAPSFSLSGPPFATDNSGNRVLAAGGGSDLFATSWPNNTNVTLSLGEEYDPMNAYDPTTGVFTVPQEGLYHILGKVALNIGTNGDFKRGSGSFNGDGGYFNVSVFIDDKDAAAENTIKVLRGSSITGGHNYYTNNVNCTVWLKAGQTIRFKFRTYGLSNMAANLSDIKLGRNGSYYKITKIL